VFESRYNLLRKSCVDRVQKWQEIGAVRGEFLHQCVPYCWLWQQPFILLRLQDESVSMACQALTFPAARILPPPSMVQAPVAPDLKDTGQTILSSCQQQF